MTAHLELEHWNEYLTENGAVFLFHLLDGIKRYEVYDFINMEDLLVFAPRNAHIFIYNYTVKKRWN